MQLHSGVFIRFDIELVLIGDACVSLSLAFSFPGTFGNKHESPMDTASLSPNESIIVGHFILHYGQFSTMIFAVSIH